MQCPKCAYERKPEDQAPEYECPKCGIVYHKYNPEKSSANRPIKAKGNSFWEFPRIKDWLDAFARMLRRVFDRSHNPRGNASQAGLGREAVYRAAWAVYQGGGQELRETAMRNMVAELLNLRNRPRTLLAKAEKIDQNALNAEDRGWVCMMRAQAQQAIGLKHEALDSFRQAILNFRVLGGGQIPAPMAYIDYAGVLSEAGRDAEGAAILEEGKAKFRALGMMAQVEMLEDAARHIQADREHEQRKVQLLLTLKTLPLPMLQTDLYAVCARLGSQEDLRYALYDLEKSKKITRRAKGRSYLVTLPGRATAQPKVERGFAGGGEKHVHTGPRGGRYTLGAGGERNYVGDKKSGGRRNK